MAIGVDYFPLSPGRVMAYATRSPQGRGVSRFKVLRLETAPGRVEARCERFTQWAEEPPQVELASVTVDRQAVRVDGEVEYKFPVVTGVSWDRHPRRYEITSLDVEARTDGGVFAGCLEVTYTIAGGDAGFGRRLYAPNVGFVYESSADETDPYEIRLTGVTG